MKRIDAEVASQIAEVDLRTDHPKDHMTYLDMLIMGYLEIVQVSTWRELAVFQRSLNL